MNENMTLDEFKIMQSSASALMLVDFFADWCEPCKILDEILVEVSQNLTDKLTIVKIDVDDSEEIKKEYNIMSVPTLMIFKNENLAWRMPGFMLAPDLTRKIEEFL